MHKQPCFPQILMPRLFTLTIVSLAVLSFFSTGTIHAASPADEEVIAFFRSVEETFKNKNVLEIVRHIDRDFSYIMTYSTPDNFSYLESDFETYRANVGAFFKSKPEIHQYSITVEDIQRSGDDIMVLARLKSVVQLEGIINSCDASSNYLVQKIENEFLIRDVRGDATCTNMKVD